MGHGRRVINARMTKISGAVGDRLLGEDRDAQQAGRGWHVAASRYCRHSYGGNGIARSRMGIATAWAASEGLEVKRAAQWEARRVIGAGLSCESVSDTRHRRGAATP